VESRSGDGGVPEREREREREREEQVPLENETVRETSIERARK
jgi:hypothetical protein